MSCNRVRNRRRSATTAVTAIMVSATAINANAGTIVGTVIDSSTGKPAAAATVSIAGTSYAATTSSDGRFTLQDVPNGTYTVTASYRGLRDGSAAVTVADGPPIEVNINTREVTLSEVVVATNRYEATAVQMNAVNTVSVLSADDLAHTAVHNVAEALGLLPGVNVLNTGSAYLGGVDGASRGEGMFASIRGLNTEYNVNLINGVEVAQGMPYSRGVQLSLLPPSGLQTISINKTSTADMDGDAIGGTVDFRTPNAFDFGGQTHASLTAGGRIESRARDYHEPGTGGTAAGEFSAKIGADDQFGVYGSAFWDVRHFNNSFLGAAREVTGDGAWAYAITTASGGNPPGFDPSKNLETTGFNVGASSGYTRRYGGNMSLDWRPGEDTSVYFRGSYALADTRQDSTQSQVLGRGVSYQQIGTTGLYQPLIKYVSTRAWYFTNPEKATLASFQLGGETRVGAWTLAPKVFSGYGVNDRPNHIEISTRPLINGGNGFLYGSSTLATYDSDGFPYPLLTPAMFAQLGDPSTLPARRAGQLTQTFSEQRKTGGQFDAKYDIGKGALDFLKVGVKYVRSERDVTTQDWTTAVFSDGRTYGSLGIINGWYSSVYPGVYNWSVPKVNQAALFNLFHTYVTPSSFDTCASLEVNNWNCDSEHGTEAVTSAYALLNLKFGDSLEVIPGMRFEHTVIDNTFWVIPYSAGVEQPGYWSSNTVTYNRPLPSLFVNYRPSGDTVYRGSIWTSYTRPPFVQLGGGSQIHVSPDGTSTITQSNPNLKPITSVNIDLSGEWSNSHGGHAAVAAYGKLLSNYIYDNGNSIVSPITSGSGTALITEPSNGGSGHVYGVELSARQKFQDLPAPFDGFGIGANVTRQTTRVNLGVKGLDPSERIQNAPNWMANAEVFYEKRGFSVNAIYHYTSSYISQYDYMNLGASWDDLWIRPVQRVDLHAGYNYHDRLQIDLSVANVFKDISYWSHVGEHSIALSDIVDSGRTTLLTAKYNF